MDLVVGIIIGIRTGWPFGIIFGLLGIGLALNQPIKIEQTAYPNQGLRNSLFNASQAIIFCFGLILLGKWLFSSGFPIVFVLILIFFPFLLILSYGGLAATQQVVLRLVVKSSGILPFNLVSYLDSMTDLVLLQRVGGGWVFLHRSLQEYFAALKQT